MNMAESSCYLGPTPKQNLVCHKFKGHSEMATYVAR